MERRIVRSQPTRTARGGERLVHLLGDQQGFSQEIPGHGVARVCGYTGLG
jgi:hypothetical protein